MKNRKTLQPQFIILDAEELKWINKKYGKSRLIFAVLLKFFQLENRFPTNNDEIPLTLTHSLSTQLKVSEIYLKKFDFENRTAKRFKQEVRELLGYQETTKAIGEPLIQWLIQNEMSKAPTYPQCVEKAMQYFRDNKIEPCSPKELKRYIQSAYYQFEKNLFSTITSTLEKSTIQLIDELINDPNEEIEESSLSEIKLRHLKKDCANAKLKNVQFEIDKIKKIRLIKIPEKILEPLARKLIKKYYLRIMAELPGGIKKYSPENRYAIMTLFCYMRSQILTDNSITLLMQLIHKMKTSAEKHISTTILAEVKKVSGKFDILYKLSSTALQHPDGIIREKIYPQVNEEILQQVVKEFNHKGKWYQNQVQIKMGSLYSHAHRKVLLTLLDIFEFKTNHAENQPLLEAIEFIKNHRHETGKYYTENHVPATELLSKDWNLKFELPESTEQSTTKIHRVNYEIAVLEALYQRLYCKAIWVVGAYQYRNPDEDLPKDFDENPGYYYRLLDLPTDPDAFIELLKTEMRKNLQQLNNTIKSNAKVKILDKDGGHIKLSPSEAQLEPQNLRALQYEVNRRWKTINLLDILKEADLLIGFTKNFHTVGTRESIDHVELQKRLLLCLYAIGSNVGLKRIGAANPDTTETDLRYIKKRFINETNVRNAIVDVVNKILEIRDPEIFGTATTGCACDSTKVSSWDQNLLTEWHVRYRGRGVMIYWHVDKKSTCIYSQLKTCSSSEVGSMIKGVLRHCTEMDMNKAYVDTHGQSTIGFAFSHLLHFDLLPRLKNLYMQKLYYPTAQDKTAYNNLTPILKLHINWDSIKQNYNEVVKHVAALKTATVEPDIMIKKFSDENFNHPVYKALTEIGHAVKTIFLCKYLMSEELRIEIHESLNVVERLNSVMHFIFYGKLGEISTNNTDEQELAIVSLHLLQVCMVYINTVIIQEILSEPAWKNRLTGEDKRALSPLIHSHINPYGLFPLDLNARLFSQMLKPANANAEEGDGIGFESMVLEEQAA